MHEDAGRRRRRRMLLLIQPHLQKSARTPISRRSVAATVADQDYLSACGVRPATLRIEDPSGKVLKEQPLNRPLWRIGRGPENDLWLNHEAIPSRLMLLAWLPGGLFYLSLTDGGGLVGPRGLARAGWWTPGLTLQAGEFLFQVEGLSARPPRDNPLAVSPVWEAELPRLELRFHDSITPRNPWRLTRPLTLIGQHPVCKIRLDHGSVAPIQAALIRTSGRLWLVNLGAPEKTCVNGRPAHSAPVEVGDRLSFGDFQADVQTAADVEFAATADNLPGAMQEFQDQQQQLLQSQLAALKKLEAVAVRANDAARLKEIRRQIRGYESMLQPKKSSRRKAADHE